MRTSRVIVAVAFVLAILGIASPAHAAAGGSITGTSVVGCNFVVTVTTDDPGDYAVTIWDDGTQLGAVPISPTQAGQQSTVYFTIAAPILQGAAGLGLYLQSADEGTTYDSDTQTFWSDETGGACGVDPPPSITVAGTPASITEGGAPGSFTFTLSSPAESDITVTYTVGGDAVAGDDYTALATAVIPTGETSVSVSVVALSDGTAEADRVVSVTVTPAVDYVMGATLTASMTIVDGAPTSTAAPTTTSTAPPATPAEVAPQFTG